LLINLLYINHIVKLGPYVLHIYWICVISIAVPSKIDEFRTNVNPRVIVNNPLTIACPAYGIPLPVISWYKDGEKMNVTTNENIQVDKDGEELTIKVAGVTDTGLYTCEARNEAGVAKLNFDVFVEGLESYIC
jgi:hypothetical protein